MGAGGKRKGAGRKAKDTTALTINFDTGLVNKLNEMYPLVKDRNNAIREIISKLVEKNN